MPLITRRRDGHPPAQRPETQRREGEFAVCTRVIWPDAGGAVIVGRNMDNRRDLATNLWKLPRSVRRDGGLDGGLSWVARYGSVVATAYDVITIDGLNEAGLAGHVLSLPESAYGRRDQSRPALSQAVWLQYFLDNFPSVADAVAWMEDSRVQVVALAHPDTGERLAIHLALEDATGDSAIVEYIDGRPEIHHSPDYRVVTNSPRYATQLKLLARIDGFGGDLSLPGTTRAPDRFARAWHYARQLPSPRSQSEAIASMLSVLRNTAQPARLPEAEGHPAPRTIWHSVLDLTARRYVFASTTAPGIVWVDLADLDFEAGSGEEILDLARSHGSTSTLVGDVSALFERRGYLDFLRVEDDGRVAEGARR